MQVQTLPAAAGWAWLGTGFAIFRRNPPLLAMLVVTYWLTILLLNVLPVIGAVAASLIIPGLSVGLMQAARDLDRGQKAGLQTLFSGLQRNPRTLIALGALYLCCTLGVLGLSALIDGGQLLSFMISGKGADKETVESGELVLPSLFVMTLMLPVLMAYWFAPVLAAWHGLSVGKSLFFSFVACWLNWRAFLFYSAALVVFAGVVPGLVLISVVAVSVDAKGGFMTAFVITPLMMVIALMIFSTVYASFYASYRDIFGPSEIV